MVCQHALQHSITATLHQQRLAYDATPVSSVSKIEDDATRAQLGAMDVSKTRNERSSDHVSQASTAATLFLEDKPPSLITVMLLRTTTTLHPFARGTASGEKPTSESMTRSASAASIAPGSELVMPTAYAPAALAARNPCTASSITMALQRHDKVVYQLSISDMGHDAQIRSHRWLSPISPDPMFSVSQHDYLP